MKRKKYQNRNNLYSGINRCNKIEKSNSLQNFQVVNKNSNLGLFDIQTTKLEDVKRES